jgi:hypothetical protein
VFRRKRSTAGPTDAPGVALRAMALAVAPADIGVEAHGAAVWGFVMDTGMEGGGWHALVVFADGTTSLYTHAQFGVIGAGAHDAVRTASQALLASAADHLQLFGPDDDDSTPPPGQVVMRALTFDGRKAVTAAEEDLGHMRHPASPVFHAAHAVISAIRQATPL